MKCYLTTIKQPLLMCQLLLCLLKKQVPKTSIHDPEDHINSTGSNHVAIIIPNQMDILHSGLNNNRPIIPLMLLDSAIQFSNKLYRENMHCLQLSQFILIAHELGHFEKNVVLNMLTK